jgi:hypothetical protein
LLAKKKWRIETNFCDECNSIFLLPSPITHMLF